jgi:hypothetical protein
MVQALISLNTVVGSDDDMPINTLITLSNVNNGGEGTYLWSIVDQPVGAADALSSTSVLSPTLTPLKEGTYLIQLVVNGGTDSEVSDRVIIGVRQLKTLLRAPAADETTENGADGWAVANNEAIQRLDDLVADPGCFIMVNPNGFVMNKGAVVMIAGRATIKAGLPGEEVLPTIGLADMTAMVDVYTPVFIVESAADGTATVAANGGLARVRAKGLILGCPNSIAAGLGDHLYLGEAAAGTYDKGYTNIARALGRVVAVTGGLLDIDFDGGLMSINATARNLFMGGGYLTFYEAGQPFNLANSVRLRSSALALQVSIAGGAWAALGGGSSYTVSTKVAAYTAVDGDVLLCDASGGAFSVTLPPAASGASILVKKTDASANAVTVDGDAAETIDGALTLALAAQYAAITLWSDGTSWWVF